MFEFSSTSLVGASFRSRMSERVSRQFEASRPKTTLNQVLRPELSSQLRSVGVRSVSVKVPSPAPDGPTSSKGQPRQFASRTVGHQAMLKSMALKLKRAASASVFQRMRARLATFHAVRHQPVSNSASSVRVASGASRLH